MTLTNDSLGTPTASPPGTGGRDDGAAGGTSVPTISATDFAAMTAGSMSAPALHPPAPTGTTSDQGVTATWREGVRIDALWSIDETRNSFVNITGVGWRKVYDGRDGAHLALVMLASQARQTNRPVNLREEADGMIHEIYLW
ncbi:hypothetical protein [Kineococcus indalonis]|uniref:hypothetical protein n=1 Tax=Kineococcus indalonis TaxID=2696566 RepID=UPI0014121246|nr:hypothetical protein [Kineococcus indalonis]NAZ86920.1 hypothetical protein [Kineococcus indalonis]